LVGGQPPLSERLAGVNTADTEAGVEVGAVPGQPHQVEVFFHSHRTGERRIHRASCTR
jgi:hypothetical protein